MMEFDVLNAARKSLRRHLGDMPGVTDLGVAEDHLIVSLLSPEQAGEVPDCWEGIPVRTQVTGLIIAHGEGM